MTDNPPLRRLEPRVFKPAPPRPPFKSANVTAFRWFIEVVAKAITGLNIHDRDAAHFLLPVGSDEASLGRHVRLALEASRFFEPGTPEWENRPRIPTPEAIKASYAPLLKLAKVRSRRALFDDAHLVSLRSQDGVVTISPTVNTGGGGFTRKTWMKDLRDVTVALDAGDEALGRAVREGLAISR